MSWFNSIEVLSKLIPIAQLLIVLLTVFTIWASVHRGNLEKIEKTKMAQEIESTRVVTDDLTNKNMALDAELKENLIKLSDLKKKAQPRSVLPEQKTRLAILLPASPSFRITAACRMMDLESFNYAEGLIRVFRDLNWQTGKTNRTFLDDIPGDIVIAITEDRQVPTAEQISKALNSVGIITSNAPIRKESISGIQANTIYLIVGAKK